MTKLEQDDARRTWEQRIEDFRASGLSGPKWCEQHGFKLRQLRYWVAKCKAPDATASSPVWVAVSDPSTAVGPRLTIRIGTAEITVESGFNPTLLQSVVRTLASC
jgi:hypothetical protein